MSKQLRVGSIGYSCNTGLGRLLKDFYDHGLVTTVLNVNHQQHGYNEDWYDNNGVRLHDKHAVREWVDSLDVLLLFETAFDWLIVSYALKKGKKVALMPMYECTPKLPIIDELNIVNPSELDQQNYPQGVHIPVPVPDWIKWKPVMKKIKLEFVHNGGNIGLLGRNNTARVIEAMKLMPPHIDFLLRTQLKVPVGNIGDNKKVFVGTERNERLYSQDVFVFPERFNGLSLPLQEAKASGMIVVATDRFPMNNWLTKEWLIKPSSEKKVRINYSGKVVTDSVCDVIDIVDKVNQVYYTSDEKLFQESLAGKDYREEMRWSNIKSHYVDFLNNLN